MRALVLTALLVMAPLAMAASVSAAPLVDAKADIGTLHCPRPDSVYCIKEWAQWIQDGGEVQFVCQLAGGYDCTGPFGPANLLCEIFSGRPCN